MTLVKHELRQARVSLAVWTLSIGLLMVCCILLFPEMKGEMESVTDIFASMGAFTQAFGMDRLNFGTFVGFYAVECGNILGLGGAFFAALAGVGILSKEEKDHTAEFLLTHPVSRARILTEKLAAVLAQLVILNAAIFAMCAASAVLVGEEVPWKELGLLHLAYFLLQVELAGVCFGISAFLRRSALGVGLGLATVLYFLNLMANISEKASFLRYITPFAYTEGADIVSNVSIDLPLAALGMAYAAAGVAAAYWYYGKKDIR